MTASRILAVIPARSGSKGLPGKNTLPIVQKPLIGWTIESALHCELIDRVVVSTDCREIAKISALHGAEVPFIRPAKLATDSTPGIDVVLHAIDHVPDFDIVVLLQPTSPLRTTDDITRSLERLIASEATSSVSVCLSKNHPNWMKRISKDGLLIPYEELAIAPSRQQLDCVYALNGAIYIARCDALRKSNSFHTARTLAYVMPPERSLDIDNAFDFRLCELILLDRLSTATAPENQ